MEWLSWKTPRLSFVGTRGIAVRTKWQSGRNDGDALPRSVKGNRRVETQGAPRGKPTRT